MNEAQRTAGRRGTAETIVRFGTSQVVEHWLIMVSFTALVVTGLPQRFPEAAWSQWTLDNLGGIYRARFIHRAFGFVLTFAALYHLAGVVSHVFLRKRPMTMALTLKDFKDTVAALRYGLGLADDEPRYGRFDFGQKFEYWGMVFGTCVMVASGFILMYPVFLTRVLPGEFVPAAKAIHGYEGLFALLIVLVWHLYHAHFGPGKFPVDTTIFTGRISRERMMAEHPLEYEERLDSRSDDGGERAPGAGPSPGPAAGGRR